MCVCVCVLWGIFKSSCTFFHILFINIMGLQMYSFWAQFLCFLIQLPSIYKLLKASAERFMVECEGGHALFPSPCQYLQIVSISVPSLGVQRDENQELGLDYRLLGHIPFCFWRWLLCGQHEVLCNKRTPYDILFLSVFCEWLVAVLYAACWNTMHLLL
jgi:hypothetical protein